MNKFIQYELWKDCRNGCKFCFNKGQPDLDKNETLDFVLSKLVDEEVDAYNEIGFIGGEFFDNQLVEKTVRDKFYKLVDICSDKRKNGKLNKLYITTSLVYDMKNYLIPFLNYLTDINLIDIVLLCTSYDSKYRFHNENNLNLWSNNMKELSILYPRMKLHTEIILTQFFINEVLEDKFSINEFEKEYNTRIDYIEPASGFYYTDKCDMSKQLPDFFPTKKSFIQFIQKVGINNNLIDLKTFLHMGLRSMTIYYTINGERHYLKDRHIDNQLTTKHKNTSFKYEIGLCDSSLKMRDIVEQIKSLQE